LLLTLWKHVYDNDPKFLCLLIRLKG